MVEAQEPSKNKVKQEEKKLKKKMSQAIAVMVKTEQKQIEELLAKDEVKTKNLLVVHFGNGK